MKKRILIFITLLLLVFSLSNKTYSRYIINQNIEANISSVPFYFEATADITTASMLQGSFIVNLDIKNYNNDAYNEQDIGYSINIKEKDKFKIGNLTSRDTNNNRTLTGGKKSSEQITLRVTTVEHVNLEPLETLNIVITTFYPYQKTITIPILVNIPAIAKGFVNDYRNVEIGDTTYDDTTQESFNRLYGDNNGNLVYDTDGSILLDSDNAIPVFDRTSRNYTNGYSVYITIKGNIYQWPTPPKGYDNSGNPIYDSWGPATIFAMSDVDIAGSNRLSWFGFRNGYFQIYSYCNDTFNDIDGESLDKVGFRSFKIDEKYNNKILNIQVTGIHDGMTNIYFNGELFHSFESGIGNGSFNTAVIGDLRPLRGLKFTGNFYDIAVYDRVLTADEISQNWNHAKMTWGIE